MKLPTKGLTRDELDQQLRLEAAKDVDWKGGKIWTLVYYAGDDVAEVLGDTFKQYLYTNGLGPTAFKSLKRFESEVIAMTAELLGDPNAIGNMTTGGTESILMAVKSARDWARDQMPQIEQPEIVVPITAHPAFDKAAHYLSVKLVQVPIRDDLRVDLVQAEAAITDNTIMVVGSAPNYPYGTIDDIPKLASMALARGILCHVDSCLGGCFLPFMRKLGEPVPRFAFTVPGVTTISADLHKYGYSVRGTSTIMYRDSALRRYQFHSRADWPGGLYGSPTMTGSRPGAAVAASWALMNYLGEEGYLERVKSTMDTTRNLIAGINAIPGLVVRGEPDMSVLAFGSDEFDCYALSSAMRKRSWDIERLQRPKNLHLVVTPNHAGVADQFLSDLREASDEVRDQPATESGEPAIYGALETVEDTSNVNDLILNFIDGLTRVEDGS